MYSRNSLILEFKDPLVGILTYFTFVFLINISASCGKSFLKNGSPPAKET